MPIIDSKAKIELFNSFSQNSYLMSNTKWKELNLTSKFNNGSPFITKNTNIFKSYVTT